MTNVAKKTREILFDKFEKYTEDIQLDAYTDDNGLVHLRGFEMIIKFPENMMRDDCTVLMTSFGDLIKEDFINGTHKVTWDEDQYDGAFIGTHKVKNVDINMDPSYPYYTIYLGV